MDVSALLQELEKNYKISRISIFYNGSIQQDKGINATKNALPPEIPLFLHDMRKEFGGGSQDLYVTGNSAKMYHNEGSKRVYTGHLPVFEAKV